MIVLSARATTISAFSRAASTTKDETDAFSNVARNDDVVTHLSQEPHLAILCYAVPGPCVAALILAGGAILSRITAAP